MHTTRMRRGARSWVHALIAAMLPMGTTGCGADPGNAETDRVSTELGAFGEANCINATPDFTNVLPISPLGFATNFSQVSPQTYTNSKCGKSLVYLLRDSGIPTLGSSLGSVSVYYGEHGPTNQADCQVSETNLIVYTDKGKGAGGTWYPVSGNGESFGYWSNNRCYHTPSTLSIPFHVIDSSHTAWLYKVFATARHADGSTAKMVVQSGPCGHIGQLACANSICDEGTAVGGSPSGYTTCQAVEQVYLHCDLLDTGSVDANEAITLSNTGSWNFVGHAHDSGAFGLNYTLGMAAPKAYNGFQFGVVHSGVVHGTADFGSRDSNFSDSGADSRVFRNWDAIKADANTLGWGCNLHTSANPWLVAEDALVGLGIAALGTAATLFLTDAGTKCSPAAVARDPAGDGVSITSTCENPKY